MKNLYLDFKLFFLECRAEDFGFYMVSAYIIFSYLRPQAIFPELEVLPWTQISIILGLLFALQKRKLKFQLPHFVVLLFCTACLLSSYTSKYPEISFAKLSIIFVWLLEILFFTSCINTVKQFRLISILFFLVLFKISFFGARAWAQRGFGFRDFGISGPSGYFSNSGELSLLMAMMCIMSVALLYNNKDTRKIYFFLPITAFMTVMAASSRGGQLALLVGSFLFLVIKGNLKIRYIFLAITLVISAYALLPEEQKARFTSAGSDSTSQARLLYWSKGLEIYKEYPVLGVGYQCFAIYFHEHYASELAEKTTISKKREVAHNTFVQVASEMGTIGLITYLWVCFIVFKLNKSTRHLLKKSNFPDDRDWIYQFSIGLDISQIVFFIGASFMTVTLYPYNYFMIMFALAMNNSVRNEMGNR